MYADENISYFNKDSGDAVFNYNEMGIVNIDLSNINLDDNFDEDAPNTIILIRHLAWHTKFKKHKELNKELMSVAWYPKRLWEWWESEDEKMDIDPMFINVELQSE